LSVGDRPPLSTVDSGWEDDDLTMDRSPDQDPEGDPVGWQPSAQAQEIAMAARASGAAAFDQRASSMTMALQREELDHLIADSSSTTGEIQTVSLGSREIQKLLDEAQPPDGGGFRVGGPGPKAKESDELNFDAFDEAPQAPLPPAVPPPLNVPPSRYGPPPEPPPAVPAWPPPAVPAWPEPQQHAFQPPAAAPRYAPPPAAPSAAAPARAWALEVAARIAADAQSRAQPADDVRASREVTSPGELHDGDAVGAADPSAGYVGDPGGSAGPAAHHGAEPGGETIEIEEAETETHPHAWDAPIPTGTVPLPSGPLIAPGHVPQGYAPVPPPPPSAPISAPISAPWTAPLSMDAREVRTSGPPSLRQSPRGVHLTILVAAVASFTVALSFALWLFVLRKGDKPPVVAAAPTTTAGLVHSTPPIAKPPPPVDADTEARLALERLREGVSSCVRDTIRVLPGSSPAVPPTMKRMKGGAYESTALDWRTPVWICSKYKVTGPQRFQIQWQQDKVPSSGMGVAWIDANGDGVADRAFGFKATLKQRGEVEMGEVQAIDATRPVAVAR
jgi:hypothetical protein